MHTSDTVTLVVSTRQTPQRKEHYMSKAVLGLSVTQITIGALCFMLQLVLFGLRSPVNFVGQGIWTGIFFCVTGISGIASSQEKSFYYIVTFLVLAITSAVLTVGILVASSIEMILTISYPEYSSNSVISVSAVLITVAVIQAVVAIVSAALSCHGLCGGNQNQVVMAGQVQTVQEPDGQQQMVILPFNQQGAGLPAGVGFNPVQTQLPKYNQTPPPTYEDETKLSIPE